LKEREMSYKKWGVLGQGDAVASLKPGKALVSQGAPGNKKSRVLGQGDAVASLKPGEALVSQGALHHEKSGVLGHGDAVASLKPGGAGGGRLAAQQRVTTSTSNAKRFAAAG